MWPCGFTQCPPPSASFHTCGPAHRTDHPVRPLGDARGHLAEQRDDHRQGPGDPALGYFALLGEAPPADQPGIYQSLFSHPRLRNAPAPRVAAIMAGFDPDPERRPTATAWLEAFRDGATTSSRNTMGPGTGPRPTGPFPTTGSYPATGLQPFGRPPPVTGPPSAPGRQPFPGAPVPAQHPHHPGPARPAATLPRGLLIGLGVGAAVLVVLIAMAASLVGQSNNGGTVAAPQTTATPATTSTAGGATRAAGPVNDLTTAPPTFTGPIRLTVDGVGVRNGVPDRAAAYPLKWRTDNTVDGSAAAGSARWDSASVPYAVQCVDQIARQGYPSSEDARIPFEPGLGLCFDVPALGPSHIVFLRLPDAAAQPAIQAEATVWRKPSS